MKLSRITEKLLPKDCVAGEATDLNENDEHIVEENAVDEIEQVETENVETEVLENEHVETDKAFNNSEETTVENVDDVVQTIGTSDVKETADPMNISEEAATAKEIKAQDIVQIPPIVPVHATAIFENSPNSNVMQDEIDSLVRFITSKDHLARNVNDVIYSILPSRECGNQNFRHTVQVQINVKTANLWEGARGYIWKHLGSDTWTRGNGTRIGLVRIHQKH